MTPQGTFLLGGNGFVGRALSARLKDLKKEYYVVSRGVRVQSYRASCFRDYVGRVSLTTGL